ncbi:MAG: 1-deoxy-D-xylulose-5-phosphate reductoisomerase [Gammaproteobacteria bacterium]
MTQLVTILGATGSVGVNTLRVLAAHPERYGVFALSAYNNVELLLRQCLEHRPLHAVVGDAEKAAKLREQLRAAGLATEVHHGVEALIDIAQAPEVHTVMAAIVGGAGLMPTLAAARAGKKVLLANKEALVMAGELFMQAAEQGGAKILPIDSEHNAIFQCLPIDPQARFTRCNGDGFAKIVLTASGGPFRDWSLDAMAAATPAQACKHPNWSMGQKISVDSATLVNKALELIEASYLFATPAEQIDIVIHPQSVVHSLVYYRDGSVLAQLGNPDMRTPIAYGLAWPERIDSGVASLDLAAIGKLEFEPPDPRRFPGLRLGREAAQARGAAPIVFNAANEIAVAAFLSGQVGFGEIPVIIERVMNELQCQAPSELDAVLAIDAESRALARRLVDGRSDRHADGNGDICSAASGPSRQAATRGNG